MQNILIINWQTINYIMRYVLLVNAIKAKALGLELTAYIYTIDYLIHKYVFMQSNLVKYERKNIFSSINLGVLKCFSC